MKSKFSEDYSYSPEKQGDLLGYLRTHCGGSTDNMFKDPKYFIAMRDEELLVPLQSFVRVFMGFVPDRGYIVNKDFQLESPGQGEYNPHMMGAPEGIYDPMEALRGTAWSVSNLNIERLFPEEQDR